MENSARSLEFPKTAGELWAADRLEELRRDRFALTAWIRFFGASFSRARERRVEHAQAHRQVLALCAGGLAVWAVVALSGRPALAAVAAAWWLLVLVMVDWHLGMLERADGRALTGLGAANALSLARAAAIPLLPILTPTALGLTLILAGLTDVADGLIARGRDEASRLGAWLDGGVDGLLLSVATVAAVQRGLLPTWLSVLIVCRYLLPWVVIAGVYFVTAHAPDRRGYISGRAPGVVLVGGLVLASFGLPGAALTAAAGAFGGLVTVAATILFGIRSRARRARGRVETIAPQPAGRRAPRSDMDESSASIGP